MSDWYSKMSRKQLASFQLRLFTTLSQAEAKELGGSTPDLALTPEEKIDVLRFVAER
jgi:hypothetical protein